MLRNIFKEGYLCFGGPQITPKTKIFMENYLEIFMKIYFLIHFTIDIKN